MPCSVAEVPQLIGWSVSYQSWIIWDHFFLKHPFMSHRRHGFTSNQTVLVRITAALTQNVTHTWFDRHRQHSTFTEMIFCAWNALLVLEMLHKNKIKNVQIRYLHSLTAVRRNFYEKLFLYIRHIYMIVPTAVSTDCLY